MYPYNHGSGSQVPQGYNPAFVTPPGFVAVAPPAASAHLQTVAQYPAPTPALTPVQVPPGYHPIELVQFQSADARRGHPVPLHWALFVRTAPSAHGQHASASAHAHAHPHPCGNYYELVGTPDTCTAQFLPNVPTAPETHPDWRGTHVIGWVHPAQLGAFERAVRQVPVWRHQPAWRSRQWVYDVVCAVGGRCAGMYMDSGMSFAGLERRMGRLLEAWENGDI